MMKNLFKAAFKPAKIIKAIKAAPEGGSGNLYRPAVVKLAIKFIFFWGVIAMLLFAVSKGFIDQEVLVKFLEAM